MSALKANFPRNFKAWGMPLEFLKEEELLMTMCEKHIEGRSPAATEDPVETAFRRMYVAFMNTYGNFIVALGRNPKQVRLLMIGNETWHVGL